jgi:class 3 adenylate cyclase
VRSENAIRQIFQRFVQREVTDDVLRLSDAPDQRPAPETRDVTLLFADIRGFTNLCSTHPPPLILDLLNEYFARMTEIIAANSGTVNQFLGDAILAVFGAPLEVVDSARHAVRAARQMIQSLEQFNKRAVELVRQPLQIGIGIQRGLVSLGVVHAQDRAFYCAAGTPIDQVMRVESRTRGHHNAILITEDVRLTVGDDLDVIPFEEIRFADSDQTVPLYRVRGFEADQ